MPENETDNSELDAWLAGKLSPERARQLERSLGGIEPAGQPDDELLLDLDQTTSGSEISGLVERVKAISSVGSGLSAFSRDSWRELLTPTEKPGTLGLLGDYEVIGLIAAGGMATILKARDPKLDRVVALKVLPPELSANANARARFLREARAAARLEHDNILPIYAVHEERQAAFFAMRYVPTGSLQDALDRRDTFEIGRLKAIARGIAAALEVAHGAGIIHRDIKPANILLGESEDQALVCDFGIARSTEDPAPTYRGTISGTPQHMSPEQAVGKPLDGRSDLFSLGSVLYRCATGQAAHAGNTTASVLHGLAGDTPALVSSLNPKLPKWFANLLAKLLSKDPEHRPRDASEVIQAIDSERSSRPRWQHRTRRRLAAAAIAAAVVLLLLQFQASRRAVSHGIASVSGRGFLVESRLGAFQSLPDAIAAAGPGDTITIRGRDTILIDDLTIPSGKELTLVAEDPGRRPTLTVSAPGMAGITSHGTLTLKDLDFLTNPGNNSDGLIRSVAGTTRLENCRMTNPPGFSEPPGWITPRAIELLDGGTLELEHCQLNIPEVVAISCIGETDHGAAPAPLHSITIRNSELVSSYAVHTRDRAESEGQRVRIDASNSSFSAPGFFKQNPVAPITNLDCAVENCTLSVCINVLWFQTDSERTVFDRLRWRGRNNAYPAGNDTVRISYFSKQRHAAAVHPIQSFNPGTGSFTPELIAPQIEIVGTGRSYTDLQRAIDDAPAGSTLLLRGQLFCPQAITARPGWPLHLRAAPGSKPTIIATAQGQSALDLTGPTTLEGIHFIRYDADAQSSPIVKIAAAGGEVRIDDCRFSSLPRSYQMRQGSALEISDCQSATLSHCNFYTPNGHAILARDATEEIAFRDCLLHSMGAIELSSAAAPAARIKISARRSISIGRYFLTNDPDKHTAAADLTATDCIFQNYKAVLAMVDFDLDRVITDLTWTGENNYYFGRTPFFLTDSGLEAAKVAPFRLTQFVNFRTASQTSTDTNPKRGQPFDGLAIVQPIDRSTLLGALRDAAGSPAAETLESFGSVGEPAAESPDAWKIKISQTGETFADLQSAANAAPEGATLLLRGRIVCTTQVLTPRGRTLHFRAANGAHPTIVSTNPKIHALFLNGPGSIIGIRFASHDAEQSSQPILGVRAYGLGEVLIEDCQFQSVAESPGDTDHRCLSLTDVQNAIIRRCEFRAPGGIGVLLANIDAAAPGAELLLEDCLFSGGAFIQRRSEPAARSVPVRITARRCVTTCEQFLVGNGGKAFAPVVIDAEDNVLDIRSCLLQIPDLPADEIGRNLGWVGGNNYYPVGLKVFRTIRAAAGDDFEPVSADDFSALGALSPQTSERGAVYGELFDRSRLTDPITAESMAAALDRNVGSPALDALEQAIRSRFRSQ